MPPDPYKTTDFYLAAYLRAAGFPSEAPEFDSLSRRATFVFHGVTQEVLVSFYNRSESHRVSAQGLIEGIRTTREQLYNMQNPTK